MSLTITFKEDLSQRLIEEAERQGLPVEEFVLQQLLIIWPPPAVWESTSASED